MNEQEENTSKTDNLIVLTLLNGLAYCFNVDDYMKIRINHRLSGSFMGVNHLKGYTRKNEMLPVEFNEYETQLLLDEHIAILVSKKSAFFKGPNEEVEKQIFDQIEKRILEQEKALNEKKVQETLKNISKVMAGKRKKLLKSGVPEKDIKLSEEEVIDEMKSSIKFDRRNAQLEISNQCLYDHEGEIVNFEIKDKIGYKVFRDIWKMGKVYVTEGGNFGGNFLVYPGDPLAYHASHVIYILDTPEIQPLDLIAKCRLTVTVNKLCTLVYVDSQDVVKYQTVNWQGTKDKLNYINSIKQNSKNSYTDTDDSEEL